MSAIKQIKLDKHLIREALNIGIVPHNTHECIEKIKWLIMNSENVAVAYCRFEASLLAEYEKIMKKQESANQEQ